MFRYVSMLIALLVLAFTPTQSFANCGPWGVWGDSDYCISCPNRTWKENSCPGGEVGLANEGVLHNGCLVSYYSPSTCHIRGGISLSLQELRALIAKGRISPERTFVSEKQKRDYNAALAASAGQLTH
jgi:hypothetical protein